MERLRLFWVYLNIINSIKNIKNIFLAAQHGHLEIVKKLLDHNADIEAKSNGGMNPLAFGKFRIFYLKYYIYFFSAARCGNVDVVKELLMRNANIQAKTQHGRTPLDIGTI
jgi:ankyrin repeat protein